MVRKYDLGRIRVLEGELFQGRKASMDKNLAVGRSMAPHQVNGGEHGARGGEIGARTRSCRYDDPANSTYFNSQKCPHLNTYIITLLIGHIHQ